MSLIMDSFSIIIRTSPSFFFPHNLFHSPRTTITMCSIMNPCPTIETFLMCFVARILCGKKNKNKFHVLSLVGMIKRNFVKIFPHFFQSIPSTIVFQMFTSTNNSINNLSSEFLPISYPINNLPRKFHCHKQ